jgi:DNA-directed RNA polymerase specialized sigma24 family protein
MFTQFPHSRRISRVAAKSESADPVLQKLDTLIWLQAKIAVNGMSEQRDRVLFLSESGFGPTAIGEILGASLDSVKSILKRARKTQSKSLEGE